MNECLPEEEVQEYLNQIPHPGVKAVLNNAITPIESLNKLAKIQNECVKMIGAKLGLITVDVMYKKLGIIPLTKMIQIELAKYGYGITRKTVPSSIQALANRKGGSKSHGYCTRNCNTPNICHATTVLGRPERH